MDSDAFDLQEIKKRVGQSFSYFDIFYSLILADSIVIHLLFVIIYGKPLNKNIAVTVQHCS